MSLGLSIDKPFHIHMQIQDTSHLFNRLRYTANVHFILGFTHSIDLALCAGHLTFAFQKFALWNDLFRASKYSTRKKERTKEE